jgi:glycosyltransferase involved in cell wall biosynthesis
VLSLGEIPGVTVTGSVADVRPFAQRAALTVAPLAIARGTQNKILESLAMRVPVVCSTLAAGGVDAVAGEHLLTASAPAEYVEAIMRLLENPIERNRLGAAGHARVRSHHDWSTSMRRLDSLIAGCVAKHQQPAGTVAPCE